jgi:hypothetical protein
MTGRTPNPFGVVKKFIEAEDTLADFIANGPSAGLGGWVRDGYRKRCDQFANLPGWARALGLGSAASLGRICQPYWDDGGFDGPAVQTPFSGGQCPGVSYRVQYQDIVDGAPFGSPNFVSGTGPVIGAYKDVAGNVGRAGIEFASGKVQTIDGGATQIGAPLILGITRPDGQPDNCGDPPGDLEPGANPPPDPGPTAGPEPSDDPANPTGPPLLPIPDYDDPIGGPTPIDAPPDAGPTGGPAEGQPGGPENIAPGIPVDPGEGDDPETDFGDPPEGAVWVGCLLNFTFPEEYGNIPGSGPANEVLPRTVGNGSLVFNGGRGNAEIVRSAWQYLLRPSPALQVQGVFVNVNPGITYVVYPLSIEKCPPNQCEA